MAFSKRRHHNWKIVTRLIFITRHSGLQSANCIRVNLKNTLKPTVSHEFCEFEKNLTIVTDSASVLSKVFGASISATKFLTVRGGLVVFHIK